MQCEHRTAVNVRNSLRAWAAAGEPWHRCERTATTRFAGDGREELLCTQHANSDLLHMGCLPLWITRIEKIGAKS